MKFLCKVILVAGVISQAFGECAPTMNGTYLNAVGWNSYIFPSVPQNSVVCIYRAGYYVAGQLSSAPTGGKWSVYAGGQAATCVSSNPADCPF